jgi:hypothetical protein
MLTISSSEDAVERLNLNIPSEARARLQRLAASSRRREGELARELLLRAIDEQERIELERKLQAAQTPALKKRLAELAKGMEKLRGTTR